MVAELLGESHLDALFALVLEIILFGNSLVRASMKQSENSKLRKCYFWEKVPKEKVY